MTLPTKAKDLVERLQKGGMLHREAVAVIAEMGVELERLREIVAGVVHFGDAVAYREDTLSVALRQWIDAGRKELEK
jgi:hypothetical protein